MERKSHIDATGAIILIIFMAVLGLNQVAVKIVNDGMAPVFQAGLRSLAAAPLILIYCLWRKTPINVSREILIPGFATGFAFAFEFALLFQAVQFTTVARASVFFYTMPFWVAIGAHFLIPGEKLTPMRILGLSLAGLGVAVALSNKNTQAGEFALLGDLMALAAATGWAAIALIARTTKFSTITPDLQLLYQLVVSAILLLPLALYLGDTFSEPTTTHWLIFAAQVVLVVCIGFMTWFWVLSIYPASDMASFSFLAPLFGVLFGWLILAEALTWTIVIALFFVGAGIILVNRR
ncbi:MAG: DMT family transporter [Pseudomonadota bacterium]